MGFIEKMISQAIRRETGFNPRRLIRRVGGRNILLAGGAALAGGLLASQARSQQQAGAAAQPPSPTIDPARPPRTTGSMKQPPLPQIPTATPPGVPLPPLPTAPQVDEVPEETTSRVAEEPEAAEDEAAATLPTEVRYAITRTMVAAALADGELATEEKALIDEQLTAGDLSESQVAQIRRDLVVPPSALELAGTLPDGEAPELLVQFALVTTRSDGGLSLRERTWLQGLGNALGLRAQRVAEIENELFSPPPLPTAGDVG